MRLTLSRTLPLLLTSMLVACDRGPGASDEKGGTLFIASAGEPDFIFPPLAQTQAGRTISDLVFERLAEIGDSLNTVGTVGFTPRLARSWQWAPDSLSIAFSLDPNARWHDGRPVRANDVRFSFDLTRDPKVGSPNAELVANVDSVQVRDSLTAVVWYKRRTPEQFFEFVYQIPIAPEHVYGAIPRDGLRTAEVLRQPVGSGQFRFVGWLPQQRIELAADTTHYRGRPRLQGVTYVFSQDFDVSFNRLLRNEADFLEIVPPAQITRVSAESTLRLVRYPGLQTSFLVFNFRDPKRSGAAHPVLGDRAVRLALSAAVDRDALLRNVFDTLGTLAIGPMPRAHPAADPSLRIPAFDRARAAQLLDSAGWRLGADGVRTRNGRPLAFSILVPSSSAPRMSYSVLLQQQFRAIGARVEIEQMDFPTLMQRLGRGNFDAVLQSVGFDPSASTLRQYWGGSAAGNGGGNIGSYVNPAFDAALDSALVASDPATLRRGVLHATQLLADDAPAIWLYDVLTLGARTTRVQPAKLRADGWWAGLHAWFIPESERPAADDVAAR